MSRFGKICLALLIAAAIRRSTVLVRMVRHVLQNDHMDILSALLKAKDENIHHT